MFKKSSRLNANILITHTNQQKNDPVSEPVGTLGTYIVTRSAALHTPPQMVWEAAPPSVVWIAPRGVGSGGCESPSVLFPVWCGVLWVGIPLPPPCGVGFGGVEFVLGSLAGVESLVLPEWGLLAVVKLL